MAKKSRKAAQVTIDINANVASLAKDMKKVTGELDGLGQRIKSLQTLLTASFGLEVFKTALPYVKDFAGALGTLAERGEKFGGIADAFDRLGGSRDQIEQAGKSLLGVVDSFTLMQIANEGLLKQIPGLNDNFGKIADLGNRIAASLGIDATEGIRQVTDALTTAKEKQLEAIGITINADDAYKSYAKSVGIATDSLSEQQKQEARQIAAIGQLDAALQKLAPASDSVANSMAAIQAGISEAVTEFSIGINSSDELTAAFRDLGDVLAGIDWESFGGKVATFVSMIVDSVNTALPYLTSFFETIMDGFALVDRTILEAKANGISNSMGRAQDALQQEAKLKQDVQALKDYVRDIDTLQQKVAGAKTKKEVEDLIPTLGKYVDIWKDMGNSAPAIKAKLIEITTAVEKQREVLPEVAKIAPRFGQATAAAFNAQAKAAADATKKVDAIREAFAKYVRSVDEAQVKDAENLASMSDSEFEQLKQKFAEVVRVGFYEEWKEKIALGAQDKQEVMIEAERKIQAEGKKLDQERLDARAKREREIQQQNEQALNRVYSQAGQLGDQLGVDLSGVFDQLSQNFGSEMSGIMEQLAGAFGMNGSGGLSAGAELGQYAGLGLQAINLGISAKGKDKKTKSNQGTGEAVGFGLGAIVGGIFGGPFGAALGGELGKAVGGLVGSTMKWGPQNKETQARHVFANWMEDQLKQFRSVSLFNNQGQVISARGSLMNFVEGDTGRFNKPGWADEMNAWGTEARATFDGLGTALKELLGITEDVGGQIAYLLGQNLAGNIDNARLMVYQLGLSFDDLSEALLKAAKQGDITWQQYQANLAGVEEAFKPGLKGVNDMKSAVDLLVGSGGRGMAALKGLRDIVVEAIEGGAKSLDDLKAELIKGGMSAEDADKFIAILKARGIKTLEEVANLTEAQQGQIIADIGNGIESINNKWKELGTNLDKIKVDMDNLPTEKDIKINFKATFDENMQKAQDAGLLDRENRMAAVPAPNLNSPAQRVGQSNVQAAKSTMDSSSPFFKATNYTVQVDARGADPGVEERLENLMKTYREVIVSQAVNTMMEVQARS